MPVQANPRFNDPALGAAFQSLSQIFQPPSGSDLAGYATAKAKKEEAQRLADLFDYAHSQDFNQSTFDRLGQASGQWTPSTGYYGVDVGAETARRGQEITAETSRANNGADNARAMQTNAADNERALKIGAMDNQRQSITSLFGPLNEGQIRPAVPADIAAHVGLPAIDQASGAPKPLSETEWQAQQNERLRGSGALTDSMLLDAIVGDKAPVQAIGPDGKTPVYMAPGQAARSSARPYNPGPNTVINNGSNGVPYGEPEKGTVWARSPDGSVKLDERGAPIAIPYQGGSVFKQQQEDAKTANAKDSSAATKRDVVIQDLDRALASIGDNPALTTGVGAQLTGGLGGSPARDVNSLLDTVRASVGFEQLQQMREASPTGGALGQVTEKEQKLLQSVLGSLDTAQSAEQLTDNLKRLKNVYLDIIHGPGNGPPREEVGFQAQKPDAGATPIYATNPNTGERLVLRNGTWEPAK